MTAKIGRNQPCPCGSGKKYKHCCLATDQASVSKPPATHMNTPTGRTTTDFYFGEDDLERLSNRIVDLINDGRFDAAQAACQALKDQYPDTIDWLMRTAMLHEARGEKQLAIEYCERTLAFMDDNPDDFEPASREPFQARHRPFATIVGRIKLSDICDGLNANPSASVIENTA